MTKKIPYPRKCVECGNEYEHRQSFSRHIQNGTCEKHKEANIAANNLAEEIEKKAIVTNEASPDEVTCYKIKPQNIYLAQMCHHISTGEDVYKCGRSHNSTIRLKDYPRGSILIATNPVTNMIEAEKHLLHVMRRTFISRKDHGFEFFEGKLDKIMDVYSAVCAEFALSKTHENEV